MNFFFDYIYFRITQLFFKRQGRTGATAITVISLMEIFLILVFVFEPIKYWITVYQGNTYSIQMGKIAFIGVFLLLFFFNYKKYTGKYNFYRFHWKDESPSKRRIKGVLVVIAIILPLLICILANKYWKV